MQRLIPSTAFFVTSRNKSFLIMTTEKRYIRNENMLSPEENRRLREFRVAVAGCGGLGGYITEMLARLGIGHLTLIDGDVFEESNLNRQLISLPSNLGKPKAVEAGNRIKEVNPHISLDIKQVMLDSDNAADILKGHDAVCDALDNIKTRRVLEEVAGKLGIPMVFGAIAGWYAHIGSIMPGGRMIDKLYPEGAEKGAETKMGNPSFTPALAASLQVAETVKILLGKKGVLKNRILAVDTLEHKYEIIDI